MSIVTQRIYTGDSIVYVGENGDGGGGVSNSHTIANPGGINTVAGPFTATSNIGNHGTAHHSLFDANGNSIGYPVPEMPGGPQYVLSADSYGGMAWALFASKIQAALSSSDGSVTFTPTGSGSDVTANAEVIHDTTLTGNGTSADKLKVSDEYTLLHSDKSDNQNVWYLDPVNGLDTNSGLSRSAPKKTGDAVVIACKTAGKSEGRLVVMAGTGAVTFTAANWADATFPFYDVVFESVYTECTWNEVRFYAIFKVVGGVHTFNSCTSDGEVIVKAKNSIVNGGLWTGLINFDIEYRMTVNGMASDGELDVQSPVLEITTTFMIMGRAKIQVGALGGAGYVQSYADYAVYLDVQTNLLNLEGNFSFQSQTGNSSIKITAAKMQRTSTTRLLYLGANTGVTVNYQLVVDTMGSIVPMEIANPSGTVAGKVIELLKYEDKVDAEIVRATAAEALKADLVGGLVPSSQLPSYIDDVVDAYVVGSTPYASDWLSLTVGGSALTPESGKIYIVLTAGAYEMLEFRWSGTVYAEISKSLALGETSSTAGRGDHAKAAYDHSLLTSGNPHRVTKSDVGLGNVDNVADADKPVSTATQAALDLKANKSTIVNNSTSTAYTFLASDADTCHIVNTSAATTRTVPSDTTAPDIAIGDFIEVQNIGTGVVTFAADSGVTIRSSLTLVMYGQYSVCMLRKIAANTWVLTGERAAV